MLFDIPDEIHDLINYSLEGWTVKETATEEQRKKVEEYLEMMRREEERMISVEM